MMKRRSVSNIQVVKTQRDLHAVKVTLQQPEVKEKPKKEQKIGTK